MLALTRLACHGAADFTACRTTLSLLCMIHRFKLVTCAALLCATSGVFAGPAEAAIRLSALLDDVHLTSAYSNNPDLVTAYATEMVRYRLELTAHRGGTSLSPAQLRPEFRKWTWRAADGSLLQGFAGKDGFRLTLGNCLAQLCSSYECAADKWPVFICTDGRKRRMAVKDFATVAFDGITYRRLSAVAVGP